MDSETRRQFQWQIIIRDKQFLKIDDIIHNEDSTKFAIVYNDNGKFYLHIFDNRGKTCVDEFYLNEVMGIDETSIGNKILETPLIVGSQFFDNYIFINVYHKKTRT